MSDQARAIRDVPSIEQLLEENQELRRRAEEAEEILRALHSGEADAISTQRSDQAAVAAPLVVRAAGVRTGSSSACISDMA